MNLTAEQKQAVERICGDLREEHLDLLRAYHDLKDELSETRSKLHFLESGLEDKDVEFDGETVVMHWKELKNLQDENRTFRDFVRTLSHKLRDAERELASARKEFAELQGQFDKYMRMDTHFFA